MKLEWLRNISAGPKESRKQRKQKMSKLEANTKGLIERIFRRTILHFEFESLFLRVGCHGWLQDSRNNKKLNQISIVDHISFDTDICSCGLEST